MQASFPSQPTTRLSRERPGGDEDMSNTRTHECIMTYHASLFTGLLVGLSIAVPIGPMGLLCIQRTLASGMRIGVSTGLGAATVNVAYGAMILFGLDKSGPWITSGGRWLTALGGLFLLWSASRTLMRRHTLEDRARTAVQSPLAAYGSAVALNASNPMSLILIIALLSPVAGPSAPSLGDATVLLLGMFMAAATWWVCLSGGVALLRARLSPATLVYVNRAAGLFLTFYGALALARAVRM
jgi:threonine/homoserine/homoserine lactone efflux protein